MSSPDRPADYSSRRWRTAIHEAGHVLMAVEEGCLFGDVALNKTADTNGAMNRISCRRGDDEAVRIALGGIVAVRFCRSRWYWQLFAGAYTDLGLVAEFFRGTADAEWGVEFNVTRTAAAISSRWGTVEEFAAELFRHRGLSRETACEMAARRLPLRRPPTHMEEVDWKPLVEHVHWRIKYPRGREDALRALAEGTPSL
jgi:hypothetical protein